MHPKAFPALTGLRFVAAMGVLLFHSGATYFEQKGLPSGLSRILHNGYLGVSLFFVLSGFILTFNYRKGFSDQGDLTNFYIARFARIYPVYILALALAIPTVSRPLSLTETVSVLTMVQSWTLPDSDSGYLWVMQAWTLSVELFFYLLFPFFLSFLRALNEIAVAGLATLMTGAIIYFGLSSVTPDSGAVANLPASITPIIPFLRLPEFLYGMLLCELMFVCPSFARAVGSPRWFRYGVPSERTPIPTPLTSFVSSMSKTPCRGVISFDPDLGAKMLILFAFRLISSGPFLVSRRNNPVCFLESLISVGPVLCYQDVLEIYLQSDTTDSVKRGRIAHVVVMV